MCACVCVCVHVRVCLCRCFPVVRTNPERGHWLSSPVAFYLVWSDRVSHKTWHLPFFFFPSLAGQRVPEISLCLFPVLRLQIHMMWAAGKLQCSLCLQQSLHFLLEIQTLSFLLKEQVSLLRDPSPHPLETDLHSHHSRHHHLAGSCRLRTECGP